jgi:hypothetical protein
VVLRSRVLKEKLASRRFDYATTGRMTGMKGTVSYQLPWSLAVEWAAKVGGEIQEYFGGIALLWHQTLSPGTNGNSNLETQENVWVCTVTKAYAQGSWWRTSLRTSGSPDLSTSWRFQMYVISPSCSSSLVLSLYELNVNRLQELCQV